MAKLKEELTFDIMVDLETLGTKPGSVVVGLAAKVFLMNPYDERTSGALQELLKDKIFVPDFKCTINLESSIRAGFNIDASTVEWWTQQSQDAKDATFKPHCPVDVEDLPGVFNNWVNQRINALYGSRIDILKYEGFEADDCDVTINLNFWGNGSTFDIGLLEDIYTKYKVAVPWKYNAIRDVRTLNSIYKDIIGLTGEVDCKNSIERTGAAHDCASDVQYQIDWCVQMYKEILKKHI